jgi:hypothetical protein
MSAKLPRSIADVEAFMAVAPKQVPLSRRLHKYSASPMFGYSLAVR